VADLPLAARRPLTALLQGFALPLADVREGAKVFVLDDGPPRNRCRNPLAAATGDERARMARIAEWPLSGVLFVIPPDSPGIFPAGGGSGNEPLSDGEVPMDAGLSPRPPGGCAAGPLNKESIGHSPDRHDPRRERCFQPEGEILL